MCIEVMREVGCERRVISIIVEKEFTTGGYRAGVYCRSLPLNKVHHRSLLAG